MTDPRPPRRAAASLQGLKECQELLSRHSSFAEDRYEKTALELAVIRHRQPCERGHCLLEDDVTSPLVVNVKPYFRENPDEILARDDGQPSHGP